jgi:transposase
MLQDNLSDGRIPIDNIASERTLRPWTIGRKNWLFLGHPEAVERRLQLYSVVSSVVRHQLVLQDYLIDAFGRLSQAQQQSPRDLELGSDLLLSLLPDRWAAPNRIRRASAWAAGKNHSTAATSFVRSEPAIASAIKPKQP